MLHRRRRTAAQRIFLCLAACSAAAPVRANDVTWITSGGGSFGDEANWTPDLPFSSDVPDANDIAHFGLTTSSVGSPVTYTVGFTADATNQRLVVEDDRVTFDLNGHTYRATSPIAVVLGTESGRLGRVAVMDGFLSTPLQADIEIGSVAGSSGTLQVLTDGLVLGSPEIIVGVNGGGTLSIFNGGDVIADAVTIGKNAGVTGTATITGASSSLLAAGLKVGASGNGVLNITDGGRVDSTGCTIGDAVGSTGTVTVDGVSTWNMSGNLRIGDAGPGALDIRNGSHVTNAEGDIGLGAVGTVSVSGTGTTWTCSGSLTIGEFDAGTLNITDGARVESGNGRIARSNGDSSAVTVAGNSAWIVSGLLFIGDSGDNGPGRLDITGGSHVENGQSYISAESVVNVDGVNSDWTSRAIQGIAGKLNITGGAVVRSTQVDVTGATEGTGVVVAGANSQWFATNLTIRRGIITVRNGGGLEATTLAVGDPSGTGVLNIVAGGRAQSAQGNALPGGTINVSGSTSQWFNSADLSVASRLNVTGGGRVRDDNGFVRSTQPEDAVVVRDPNSVWTHANDLSVEKGTLAINDGGRVEGKHAFIAPRSGDNGMVVVSGPGAVWAVDGRLSIGGDSGAGTAGGTAELRLQSGATVSVTQDTTLFPAGLLRLEGGTLSSAAIHFQGAGNFLWTSGTLHVGVYDGDLAAPNGGILAPGNSAGTTLIQGNYTQQAGGTLAIEIGGIVDGTQYDVVTASGNVVLGGNLKLEMLNGFVPSASDMFTIPQTNSITGTFANVANGHRLSTSDGSGSFIVNYGPRLIVLSSFLAALPGDYNQNGTVDAADYTVWRNNNGTTNPLPNDPIGGTIGQAQYDQWSAHFGQTVGSGSLANSTVPEPASALLLSLAAAAIGRRSRRLPSTR